MGLFRNTVHSLVLGTLVLSAVVFFNFFEANMFLGLFCVMGLIIWFIMWFLEVSLMKL